MSNKSNGWDGRVKRLKPPVSMSETVEKDDADGREVNASEDMLQKDEIDDESRRRFRVSCEFFLIITMYERNGLYENVDSVIHESVERRYVNKNTPFSLE